ncbi:metallophosphoesterase family protein [Novosphingobium rosa]|uniref:metallophosphoesterase family protein n=1 Tax=Novosphingobium rosa TaxID=76978 RepID=UPI000832F8F9|nr:metallophosphoesterase family protein [Novosphingobium rosa]
MLNALRSLLRPRAAAARPCVPPGQRIYAVGDIHGRADLLSALIDAIEGDISRRDTAATPRQTTIILLGDLIDRGPDSRGVLDLAARWGRKRAMHILLGNHEEMLLDAAENLDVLRHFLRHGGRETLLSFDIDEATYEAASFEEVQALLHAHIPAATLDYIRSFQTMIRMGDYVFVHAGIRPGVPLEGQSGGDLRWIREPFLSSPQDHGAVVVHGHTITDEIEQRPNRLGIDTGAYQSGHLSAIGLEGEERWLIQTDEDEAGIRVGFQPLP